MARLVLGALAVCVGASPIKAESPVHGVRPDRLVIRGATMLEGPGTPAEGPVDIVVEGKRIVRVSPSSMRQPTEDAAIIDGAGKYVLPGFINLHGHVHTAWLDHPVPLDYIYKLWLACGITTVRDVGSATTVTLVERDRSARGEIAAPRLFLYFFFPDGLIDFTREVTESDLRRAVRQIKKRGADGIKLRHFDRETVRIVMDEAHRQGLRVAQHVGIEDMNAWDNAEFGTTTIEHWYGVPDAALDGVQSFPADFDHANELHRFRHAGRLWRETDPGKLDEVFTNLIEHDVAWDPTFAIYEACRDLQRAVTQPWFEDYLHPGLAKFFEPNPTTHGSFFFGWTHTDEVYWRENFRLWMDAVRRFESLGGIVGTGEDAGYIYQVYGFCYLRELQLHEEAGFHPLEIVQHATTNGAKLLGKEAELGRIKPGFAADLIVVNGNPLENLHLLMPRGVDPILDKQRGGNGGIEWTIKDGIPYHGPTLLEDVRQLVDNAKR